jgi:hypothetical protein
MQARTIVWTTVAHTELVSISLGSSTCAVAQYEFQKKRKTCAYLVSELARAWWWWEDATGGALRVGQIPWGALGDIKVVVPVLVELVFVDLEQQAVVHQLGHACREGTGRKMKENEEEREGR